VQNLVRAGYEVSTFDLLAEAVEEVEAVMVDRDGVAYVMKAGSVWIDMSTSNVETAERVRAAGPEGPAMLDAPVCGGTHGATMGTLEVFVGGQLSAVRLVEDATGTPLRTPAGNALAGSAVPEGELTYAT
jgi:3-hydroxyisobutyrate dehydrogenase-like beta-hydroxyacid dehydrogenase